MKILFFSTAFPQPADRHRSPYNLHRCQALDAQHDVFAMCPESWIAKLRRGGLPSSFSPAGFPVSYPAFYYPPGALHGHHANFLWWSVRGAIKRLGRDFRPDVVLSYWTYPDSAVALRIARTLSVPSVAMVGGSDVMLAKEGHATAARASHVLREVDDVVTVSQDLSGRIAALGVRRDRIHVLPPAVDPAFRPGDRFAARSALNVPADAVALFWAGRMVALKYLDVLFDACVKVRASHPTLCVYLAGDGPVRRDLETRARALGLQNAVKFLGPVPQPALPDWYRAADMTVLPSLSEGTPNTLLESIACGTPFVASDVGGIPALAQDGLDELVRPGDVQGLVSAITRVASRGSHVPRLRVPGSWTAVGEALSEILHNAHARHHDVRTNTRRTLVA
jgi:teichuronic acid biosynthesis glycosyltransferase TuaC